jgi:hypothetical protein
MQLFLGNNIAVIDDQEKGLRAVCEMYIGEVDSG